MRRKAAIFLCAMGLFCAFAFGALTGLKAVFLNDRIYTALMDELSVYEDVGIAREEQKLINADLVDYLSGKIDSLERSVTLKGEDVSCAFNERELRHMEDVRRLFLIGLEIRKIMGLCAVTLLGIALFMKEKRILARSLAGLTAFLLVLIGAGSVALYHADFNALFLQFHELIFDNDLWLLDPATDALIRMLPEAFFERMAVWGALSALIGGCAAVVLVALGARGLGRLLK